MFCNNHPISLDLICNEFKYLLFIFIYFMRADFKGCLRYHRRNTGRKIFLHSAITSSKAPEALLNKIQAEENHTRMWIKQKHTKVCQLNPHMHHMSTFALWEKIYLMHISVKRKKKSSRGSETVLFDCKESLFFPCVQVRSSLSRVI